MFDRLEAQSDALVLRNETVNVFDGYLILATRRLVARLDKTGITDRSLMAEGHYKGRVSLGVYRAPGSAAKWQKPFPFTKRPPNIGWISP